MTKTDQSPEMTAAINCGHCGNRAPMEIVTKHFQRDSSAYDDERVGWDAGTGYELLLCPSCSKVELRTYDWHEGMDPSDVTYLTLYPNNEQITGLPKSLQKEYNAARKVRGISPDAYAVLTGRILELICDDRKAVGKTLNEKLADLAKKGEIPPNLVDVAKSLRTLRNVGAHATLGSLSEEEVPILDDLSSAILEYVYSAPLLVKRAEEKIAKLKAKK